MLAGAIATPDPAEPALLPAENNQTRIISPEPDRELSAADTNQESSEPQTTSGPSTPAPTGAIPPGFENLASGVPPGFESFLAEQTTVVDVFYGGRFIYSGLATFDQMEITFADPDELAAVIPGLTEVEPVVRALSQPMPLNENLRCLREQQSNCGVMYPEVADVIFNSQTYRADLFVNAGLLSLQAVDVQPYLGPSSAGFSVFQTFNIAATGSDDGADVTSAII